MPRTGYKSLERKRSAKNYRGQRNKHENTDISNIGLPDNNTTSDLTMNENGSLNDMIDNNVTVPFPSRKISNSILPVETLERNLNVLQREFY